MNSHKGDLRERLEDTEGVSHAGGKAGEPAYCFLGFWSSYVLVSSPWKKGPPNASCVQCPRKGSGKTQNLSPMPTEDFSQPCHAPSPWLAMSSFVSLWPIHLTQTTSWHSEIVPELFQSVKECNRAIHMTLRKMRYFLHKRKILK